MNKDFMCPCSEFVRSIGGCSCDNMKINSECNSLMDYPLKQTPRGNSMPKELHELKLIKQS